MKKFLICFFLCVSLASAGWAGQTIKGKIDKAIRHYVINKNPSWKNAKIKVLFSLDAKTEKQLISYGENISFKVPEIYSNSSLTPKMILPVQILEEGVERKRIFLRTRIGLYKDVVTAGRSLKKGEVLKKSTLQIKEKNVLSLKGNYFSSLSSVVGREARGHIYPGSVITKGMVKSIPDVAKRQRIAIIVKAEGLRVEAKGIALQEGKIGDTIKVKRINSKEIIQGRIQSPEKVEVEL